MKIALVLEGGGLRALYTSAIIDNFLKDNIKVDSIYGSSAGAIFGINYASNQPERTLRYNKKYLKDKRYMSFKSLITTGNYVNKDFAYYELPNKLDVFDEKAFEKSNINFYAVITNLKTGEGEYYKITNALKEIEVLRASSSLPFVSKPVIINGEKYLDGGLSESIPITKSLQENFDKIIVIKTRDKSYQKKKSNTFMNKLVYRKYPNFVKCLNTRYQRYNDSLKELYKLEKEHKIFIIEPSIPIEIGRVEKNPQKLDQTYELGNSDYQKIKKDLLKYLKG